MIDLYNFVKTLNDASLPTDIINPSASGMAANIILQTWKVKHGQRFITNFVLGEMGAGLPYSIGAAVATGRRVIHIEGDGGFQLNIQELETIRRLNLPIIMFIINNNGYASIRESQQRAFGRLTGADNTSGVTLPDLQSIAEAYEIEYFYLDKKIKKCYQTHFEEEGGMVTDKFDFTHLFSDTKLKIIEVFVDPDQQYRNRVPSKLIDGKMTTARMDEL
jgi:acetolactate synthase-1/2/3 large subunit